MRIRKQFRILIQIKFSETMGQVFGQNIQNIFAEIEHSETSQRRKRVRIDLIDGICLQVQKLDRFTAYE